MYYYPPGRMGSCVWHRSRAQRRIYCRILTKPLSIQCGCVNMCGIVGVSHHKQAAQMAFLGLYALQHRGEEAAGIVSYDGKDTHVLKKSGLAVDNFDEESISK